MPKFPLINVGDTEAGWRAGELRWVEYPDNLSCQQAEAKFNADYPTIAEKYAHSQANDPAPPVGNTWELRPCSGDVDIILDPDFETPDPVTDGGVTAIATANPNYLTTQVQYNNQGKARLVLTYSPNVPDGQSKWVSLDGQPATKTFTTEYGYSPGQKVSVFAFVAISPNVYDHPASSIGYAQISIGNPA